MSLTALLARCLLVLALVANGLPVMAMPAVEAAVEAPAACHDMAADHAPAGESAAPDALDCCDGGDCTCSCLHHAPLVLALAWLPVSAHPPSRLPLPAARPAPGPAALPSLRPPIAG